MSLKTTAITAALTLLAACAGEEPVSAPHDHGSDHTGSGLYLPHSIEGKPLGAELNEAYEALTSDYSAVSTNQIDLAPIVSVLPDNVAISWADVSLDAATGATTWQDFTLTITIADAPISMVAERLSCWGLDTEFLAARIQGQQLDESASLADRIDAQNVTLEGAAAFTENLFSLWISEFPEGEDFEELDLSFERLDMFQEKIVIDGLSLRPWEYVPLTAEKLPEELAEDEGFVTAALPIGQSYLWWIALTRSLAIDAALSTENQVQIGYGAASTELVGTYELGRSVVFGMSGYDIQASYVDDVTFFQDITISELYEDDASQFQAGPDTLLENFNFERTDSYRVGMITGLKLDKLMGHFARAELPSIDDRDLMSLGQWHFEDINSIWFGEGLFSIDHLHLNMESFVSFVPTLFDIKVEGATLEFDKMINLGLRFGNFILSDTADTATVDAEEAQAFVDALQMAQKKLPEYGFDQMVVDFALSAEWAADEGDFEFRYKTEAQDFAAEDLELGLIFPTYEAIVEALEEEDTSGAFDRAFEDVIAFLGFRYSIEDQGGFDRLLGLAQSIGAEYPEEGWGAMLANMEPAQMRTTMAAFIRLAQAEARQQFPPAVEWIESVAKFVETSGGKLEVLVQPLEPLTAESFDAPEFADEDIDWIVERLGIAVNHTPE